MDNTPTALKLDHAIEKIDGQTYIIQAMRPSRVFVLGLELTKLIGEPFAAASMAGMDEDDDKAGEAASMAIRALMKNVDPDRFLEITQELMGAIEHRDGKTAEMITPEYFEQHFHAKSGRMLKLLGKALRFQFKDFFEELLAAVGSVMEQAADAKEKKKKQSA